MGLDVKGVGQQWKEHKFGPGDFTHPLSRDSALTVAAWRVLKGSKSWLYGQLTHGPKCANST